MYNIYYNSAYGMVHLVVVQFWLATSLTQLRYIICCCLLNCLINTISWMVFANVLGDIKNWEDGPILVLFRLLRIFLNSLVLSSRDFYLPEVLSSFSSGFDGSSICSLIVEQHFKMFFFFPWVSDMRRSFLAKIRSLGEAGSFS